MRMHVYARTNCDAARSTWYIPTHARRYNGTCANYLNSLPNLNCSVQRKTTTPQQRTHPHQPQHPFEGCSGHAPPPPRPHLVLVTKKAVMVVFVLVLEVAVRHDGNATCKSSKRRRVNPAPPQYSSAGTSCRACSAVPPRKHRATFNTSPRNAPPIPDTNIVLPTTAAAHKWGGDTMTLLVQNEQPSHTHVCVYVCIVQRALPYRLPLGIPRVSCRTRQPPLPEKRTTTTTTTTSTTAYGWSSQD